MTMDLDGDGYLSLEEFRSSLGLLGIDDTFAQILFNSFVKAEHHDRDGFINRSEFCASMAIMLHPGNVEQQVSMAFDAYDTNHDGKLSLEELENVIAAMFAAMVKMRIRQPDEHPTAKLAAVDLFRHMDEEEKGFVTKEDYTRLATTNPELLKKVGLGNTRQPSGRSKLRSSTYLVPPSPGGASSSSAASPGGASSSGAQLPGSLYGVPPVVKPKRGRGAGSVVAFGHQNWELVVQMMVAIRLSVDHAIMLAKKSALEQSVCGSRPPSLSSVRAPSDVDDNGGAGAEAGGGGGDDPGGGAGGDGAGSKSDDNTTRHLADIKLESPSLPQRDSGISDVTVSPDDHDISSSMYKYVWREDIPGSWKGKKAATAFKDYAPLVFRRIRLLFGVSDRDYMLSLGPEQILGELLLGNMGSLSELFSEGKSGSFFYFTNDGAYVIKTIPHRELLSLVRLLPQYVRHVEDHPCTLLPRFMGAHRIHMPGGRKVHFVVMTNVFSSPRVIHERFDLKGSTSGRSAGKALEQHPDLVRKDLDLKRPIALRPSTRELILEQILADLSLLRRVRTMDYSLLCGVHYPMRERASGGAKGGAATQVVEIEVTKMKGGNGKGKPAEGAEEPAPVIQSESSLGDAGHATPTTPSKGSSLKAFSKKGLRRVQAPWYDDADGAMLSGPASADGQEEEAVFFIGIIDILTAWSWAKAAENFVKLLMHPWSPDSHSCVPPPRYANRFERNLPKWLGKSPAKRTIVEEDKQVAAAASD